MAPLPTTTRDRPPTERPGSPTSPPDPVTQAALLEPPSRHDYEQQELQQAAALPGRLSVVIGGRSFIEAAAGGNASWNVGVDYGTLINRSSDRGEVTALYRAAGLNLKSDIGNLNGHETIRPSIPALKSLQHTSTVTGHLDVPELDLHTISDTLAPIAYENYYRGLVQKAGDGSLLRQAYVQSIGHCNFSASELVAGVHTVRARVERGRWGASTLPGGGSTRLPRPPGSAPAGSSTSSHRPLSTPGPTGAEARRAAGDNCRRPVLLLGEVVPAGAEIAAECLAVAGIQAGQHLLLQLGDPGVVLGQKGTAFVGQADQQPAAVVRVDPTLDQPVPLQCADQVRGGLRPDEGGPGQVGRRHGRSALEHAERGVLQRRDARTLQQVIESGAADKLELLEGV
nr:hypothetical protein [Leekyejoonella antrihumi]